MKQKEIYMLIVEENPIISEAYKAAIREIKMEDPCSKFNVTTTLIMTIAQLR